MSLPLFEDCRRIVVFWARDVFWRAFRETLRLLRKHLGKELLLAAVVLVLAWIRRENKAFVDGLGESLLLLVIAAGIYGGVIFFWQFLLAPVRANLSFQDEAASAELKAYEDVFKAKHRADLAEAKTRESKRLSDEAHEAARDLRKEIEHLRTASPHVTLPGLSRQLGSELRDIRVKVERIKATNPPTYPRGFTFPAARWNEYARVLAELRPDVYDVVERAYTAAHNVNEWLRGRESRQSGPNPPLLGVIPQDQLDQAHGLAGEALDALGERHNDPVESEAQRAAREIISDVRNETLERLNNLIRDGEKLYDSRASYDRWIADHAKWRERLDSELAEADRIRAFDFAGLNEAKSRDEKDLGPAKARVDRIIGNLRDLYDEYHKGLR